MEMNRNVMIGHVFALNSRVDGEHQRLRSHHTTIDEVVSHEDGKNPEAQPNHNLAVLWGGAL